MNLASQEDPVPWDAPRQDPLFQQLSKIYDWLVPLVPSRLTSNTVSRISNSFDRAWHLWRSPERRAAVEFLLLELCKILQDDGPAGYDWSQLSLDAVSRKTGRLPHHTGAWAVPKAADMRRLNEVQACAADVAKVYPFSSPAQRAAWYHSFSAEDRMTTNKLQRTSEPERDHILSELKELSGELNRLLQFLERQGLPASRALPTADGLFLRAHDACHSAASRFERFTALLDGIDSVYGLAVKDRRHDAADAAALVDARETILVPRWNVVVQQGARYMQVSAVELARDILFETCRSWTDRKPLYSSERVIEMLKGALGMGHYESHSAQVSGLDDQFCAELLAALAGPDYRPADFMHDPPTATPWHQPHAHQPHAHQSHAHQPQCPGRPHPHHAHPPLGRPSYFSLGAMRSSRFFPAARQTGW